MYFTSIPLSQFSPEDFTKVKIFGKIGKIYTFSSIFPLKILLEDISPFPALLPNPMLGHKIAIIICIDANYLPYINTIQGVHKSVILRHKNTVLETHRCSIGIIGNK